MFFSKIAILIILSIGVPHVSTILKNYIIQVQVYNEYNELRQKTGSGS